MSDVHPKTLMKDYDDLIFDGLRPCRICGSANIVCWTTYLVSNHGIRLERCYCLYECKNGHVEDVTDHKEAYGRLPHIAIIRAKKKWNEANK